MPITTTTPVPWKYDEVSRQIEYSGLAAISDGPDAIVAGDGLLRVVISRTRTVCNMTAVDLTLTDFVVDATEFNDYPVPITLPGTLFSLDDESVTADEADGTTSSFIHSQTWSATIEP